MATTPLRDGIRLLGRAAGQRSGVPDAELLDRFVRHKDEAAFELLVWRHGAMVLGTCRRLLRDPHEADDAVQAAFLVLARRAASVGRRESIGGWLHRVAFRLALLAKAKRAKRDALRRPLDDTAPAPDAPDPAAAVEWLELRHILDDEVNRLPDAYRVPFVLCCLEGRTNADAARELGCPVGTVESRLTRARAKLRAALGRRGVALSAGLFATVSTRDAVAFIPAALVSATTKAVVGSGVASAHVAALTEGVIQAMWLTKLKTAAAIVLAAAVLGTGTGVLWNQPAAADPSGPPGKAPAATDADRIADLVKRLGGSAFADREKAAKELEAIGAPALDALRQAARSAEPERKARAEELVKRIEAKSVTAKMLAAKRVRLIYKDTPLAEAVADFKAKSGYDIVLSDPAGAFRDRKVTLDTGDVTFWQAIGKFCDATGLTEALAPTPVRAPVAGGGGGGAAVARGGGGGVVAGGALPALVSFGRLSLVDGKRPALPTDDGSAVRVRAAGKGDEPAADGEVLLRLEVAPEPRLRWQKTVGVDIARATDDQGQALEQVRSADAVPAPALPPFVAPGRAVAGGGFGMAGGPPAFARVVSVRFKKGAKPSTSLKELSGTVALQVLTEPEPAVTVDGILDAAGKTVKGSDGWAVRVVEVLKLPSGRIQVKFGIDPPPGAPAGALAHMSMRNGRMTLTTGPEATAEHEVAFVDDKGVSLPVVSAGVTAFVGGAEYKLVCQPAAGQDPAKLVHSVSRSITLDVPFTLKNVPLP